MEQQNRRLTQSRSRKQKEVRMMFNDNEKRDSFDGYTVSEPSSDLISRSAESPVREDAPTGGSYYSPRSSESSGYSGIGPDGGDEPPKKKSRKGLKALAIFTCIAFLSYASIQCYQFATENETLRKFFGRDSSVSDSLETKKPADTGENNGSKQNADNLNNGEGSSQPITAENWIKAASRSDSLTSPEIVEKITPATVGIASTFLYKGQTFSIWGWGQPESIEKEIPATGTGIIMSDQGYIITNAHVIYDSESQYKMGKAKSVQVVLNEDYYEGETHLDAEIVGYDIAEDIAVLKVNTTQKLTSAEFGESDDLKVGELVVAIGNPLGFELFGSVTTGIVSALNRKITINDHTMNLIQTDTAINAGNSGGPLINGYGQVIGINSSKISSSYADEASVEGLCFAIPMSHAKDIINQLINKGYVSGKPVIGVNTKDVTEDISEAYGIPVGVMVREVVADSAADIAGIKVHDVIIAINGEKVSTYDELVAIKDQFKAGDTITLTINRSGQDMNIDVVLQENKPEQQ